MPCSKPGRQHRTRCARTDDGTLVGRQLAGYRLLAESTMPYVDGDHFIDAAQYTRPTRPS